MVKRIKRIPLWGWGLGFCVFLVQYIAYQMADIISEIIGTKANAWCPKIDVVDNSISILPAFSIIYVFAYIFWICGLAVTSLADKEDFINNLAVWILSYLFGTILLIAFPTNMDRIAEGLLVYGTRKDIISKLMYTIYRYDGLEKAVNLCPSFHCISSVCCYLGIRKQSVVSKGFRIYTLIMAILVCMSTVFIKQHYFIDVLSGVMIPIVCYLFVQELNFGKMWLQRNGKRVEEK